MKIGILRERKIPVDHRVPFSPNQLKKLQEVYKGKLTFKVNPSPVRAFSDQEYADAGIELSDDLGDCDILMGVKEVPMQNLMEKKTYFFFSHTIKKQSYNRSLLKEILKNKIRLIDYEPLIDPNGQRVVAFGLWAGIVGAYNGFWVYGKKTGLFELKRAHECADLAELYRELEKIELPAVKIAVTGCGKVARGVIELLSQLNIKRVEPGEYLQIYSEEPIYTQLSPSHYNQRRTDGGFLKEEFFSQPELYEGTFAPYTEVSDMLIAAAYWDPRAPRLFDLEDIQSADFNISVIADITCDIQGSVPTTLRPSEIAEPVYDVSRKTLREIPAFGEQDSISVMAIDNLPCELPRDASEDFGRQLSEKVIPEFFNPGSELIKNATIAENGHLTKKFSYLEDYVKQLS